MHRVRKNSRGCRDDVRDELHRGLLGPRMSPISMPSFARMCDAFRTCNSRLDCGARSNESDLRIHHVGSVTSVVVRGVIDGGMKASCQLPAASYQLPAT